MQLERTPPSILGSLGYKGDEKKNWEFQNFKPSNWLIFIKPVKIDSPQTARDRNTDKVQDDAKCHTGMG